MPDLTEEEFRALKADVAAQGVLVALVIDEDTGEVIEGHHRLRAWTELRAEGVKVPDYPKQVVRFANDDDRVAFVLAANLFRRHLTREQRAEVVARFRAEGWSLRHIGEVVGVDDKTVRNDLAEIAEKSAIELPERVERKGGGTYPARRPRPTIFVSSPRDAARAAKALQALGDDATGLIGLTRAEERARDARVAQLRSTKVPAKIEGPAYELRLGDLRGVWADVPDGSIDAAVVDPPYSQQFIPLFEDVGSLLARVLKPGRLAAIYCGHMSFPEEIRLLEASGLNYVWHGVNLLPGRHSRIHGLMVNGKHRSVLLLSAGPFAPRRWIHDTFFAEGRGGPDTRPLHQWQQAVEPMQHWVRMTSEPGETVFDPCCGSGTTGVAALMEGRRFLGGDLDPAYVETTRRRLVDLAARTENDEAGA
jgi:site-specific DNA-methyltransferase (adenine-specific)